MTRAERRHCRQVCIARRVRLRFGQLGWDEQNRWYTEPGRLAKHNGTCSCLMCQQYYPWSLDRAWFTDGFEDELCVLRHRNRIFRRAVPACLRRGPGHPPHGPPAIDVFGTEPPRVLVAKLQAVGDAA